MPARQEIKKILDSYQDKLTESLQELIQYKSVQGEPEEDRPFGPEVGECLIGMLEMADAMGMRTSNLEDYAGTVEIGEGEEMLGILCHLDVVPAGDDWDYDPYAGVVEKGRIYGRGSLDNKGPAVASLYAMKTILDLGLKLNKRVRLILGTNEESGWKGMEYYNKNAEVPTLAFSPDAVFPVIHAEKGILVFDLLEEYNSGGDDYQAEDNQPSKGWVKVKSISGGNAPNMVPDRASALVSGERKYLQDKIAEYQSDYPEDIKLKTINSEESEILVKGISAHGSLPADGVNAVSHLICLLAEMNLTPGNIENFIKAYQKLIGTDYYGENIGCDVCDEISGRLVFNVGQIEVDEKEARITVNIRYPVSYQSEKIFQSLTEKISKFDWLLERKEHKAPLHVEKDDRLVESLMQVYRDETGDDKAEPIAIGGGTYARAVPRGVAFGPLFPGQPELAHQKNEYMEIEDLMLNALIYVRAIIELAADEKIN